MEVARQLSFKHVNKLLKQANLQHRIQAGFFGGTTYPNRPNITVAQVALWNEYGQNSVERPFMRNAFRNTANNMTMIRLLGRQVVKGHITMDQALDKLGAKSVKDIRESMEHFGRLADNKKSTVRRKGRNKPLFDTDTMYNDVRYRKV